MKIKAVSGIMVTLLFIGMLTLAFNIQPVKASGTIYIRADGSVDPPDASVQRDGDTYTFTANVYEKIVVQRDNIVVDGNGYTLQGVGSGYGFSLSARSNVTIQNMNIKGFNVGIWLWGSSYSTISGSTIKNNNWHGIQLHESSNNNISGNNITNNNAYGGVWLEYSSHTTVSGNTITNNTKANYGFGVRLWAYCYNNTVSRNTITDNNYGVGLRAWSDNNTISRNNITNNRHYGVDLTSYNTVSGNTIQSNAYGVQLFDSSDNHIYHNNFINNTQHVYFYIHRYANFWDDGYPSGGNYWSDYTEVDLFSGPFQNETGSDGICDTPRTINAENQDNYPLMYPWSSLPVHNINTRLGYATIEEAINAPETLDRHTIFVEEGTYYEHVVVNKSLSLIGADKFNTVIDGNLTGNVVRITARNVTITGFAIKNGGYPNSGIYISSSGNNISCNIITNNYVGINLHSSSYNTVSENTIAHNNNGIAFHQSSNNSIFHNDFIDNSQQVYIHTSGYANFWDDSYPSGGNYWSDYTEVDLYRGPYQNEAGSDGIGDAPYVIDGDNQDNYPLINPWTRAPLVHDIAVTDVQPSNNVVAQNQSVSINVTVENQGDSRETFNVTAYASTTAIDKITDINLTWRNSAILSFTWNTTGFIEGVYIISATVTRVPNETDTTDNTYVDSLIIVGAGPPGNLMWVNPPLTDNLQEGDTFAVDLMINVTDPDGPGPATGWWGFMYWLAWDPTKIDIVDFAYHSPWSSFYTFFVKSETGVLQDGRHYHWLTIIADLSASPFTGIMSLCTYTFYVNYQSYYPEPDYNGILDIYDDVLFDDNYTETSSAHTTYDGQYRIPSKVVQVPVHDVAITGITLSKTFVWQGLSMHINVTVTNEGNIPETVNATAYANTTSLETQTVTRLAPGANTTLIFTWNTTGFAPGNYIISANASIVPGETDTADNTYADGQVIVGAGPPGNSIWINPPLTDNLQEGDTFAVDLMINVADPDGPGPATGLYCFAYKLAWDPTKIDTLDITYHNPWSPSYSWVVRNETGVLPDGRHYHWLVIVALSPSAPFTGIMSLCTYTFYVNYQPYYPEPDYNGILDICDDELVDDTATLFAYTIYDGQYRIPSKVPATVDIDSNPLNLKSGEWITYYIELPEGYNVSDIDIYSIRLNDTFPVSLLVNPPEIGDYDDDGIQDLMVKFNRTEVASYICLQGIEYGNVTLTITGNLTDGTQFEGEDTVKVLLPGDLDHDGDVDTADFVGFCGAYPSNPPLNPEADLDSDGDVDSADFVLLCAYYGKKL